MQLDRSPASPRPPAWKVAVGFAVLFALYQSAEGVGDRLLHSTPIASLLMISALAAAWPVGRWLGWRGFDAYALETRGRWALWLGGGLLLAALVRITVLHIGVSAGVYRWEAAPAVAFAGLLPLLVWTALSTFIPSVAEDILTRGFPWRVPGVAWRPLSFVAFSSVLFVLNHIYRLGSGWSGLLLILVMGVGCASALARTGSLWAAAALHWGWNLSNALLDAFHPYDIADAARSPLYSAAAWMVLTAVVWALPRAWLKPADAVQAARVIT
jgi:hypothetical protein